MIDLLMQVHAHPCGILSTHDVDCPVVANTESPCAAWLFTCYKHAHMLPASHAQSTIFQRWSRELVCPDSGLVSITQGSGTLGSKY